MAQFRGEVSQEAICAAPLITGALGVFEFSGVSDRRAAAIVVSAEQAHRYTDKPLYVKGLPFLADPALGDDVDARIVKDRTQCSLVVLRRGGMPEVLDAVSRPWCRSQQRRRPFRPWR